MFEFLSGLPSVSLSDRAYLPPASAVYFVATADSLLYIGQASDLRRRWENHHKLPELEYVTAVRIYWLEAPAGFLNHLEAALIERFKPLLNRRLGKALTVVAAPKPPSPVKTPMTAITRNGFDRFAVLADLLEQWNQDYHQRLLEHPFVKANAAGAGLSPEEYWRQRYPDASKTKKANS